jgi:response regulator RpfG family c-di-GMP phosphodiesterase
MSEEAPMEKSSLLFLAIANRAYGGDPMVLDMLRVLFERNELAAQIELVLESEIVETAKRRRPALILAGYRQIDPDDVMPPVGEAALKELKSDPDIRDIPILLLEALPYIDAVARECGVDAYIALPWGATEIYSTVIELIKRET